MMLRRLTESINTFERAAISRERIVLNENNEVDGNLIIFSREDAFIMGFRRSLREKLLEMLRSVNNQNNFLNAINALQATTEQGAIIDNAIAFIISFFSGRTIGNARNMLDAFEDTNKIKFMIDSLLYYFLVQYLQIIHRFEKIAYVEIFSNNIADEILQLWKRENLSNTYLETTVDVLIISIIQSYNLCHPPVGEYRNPIKKNLSDFFQRIYPTYDIHSRIREESGIIRDKTHYSQLVNNKGWRANGFMFFSNTINFNNCINIDQDGNNSTIFYIDEICDHVKKLSIQEFGDKNDIYIIIFNENSALRDILLNELPEDCIIQIVDPENIQLRCEIIVKILSILKKANEENINGLNDLLELIREDITSIITQWIEIYENDEDARLLRLGTYVLSRF